MQFIARPALFATDGDESPHTNLVVFFVGVPPGLWVMGVIHHNPIGGTFLSRSDSRKLRMFSQTYLEVQIKDFKTRNSTRIIRMLQIATDLGRMLYPF